MHKILRYCAMSLLSLVAARAGALALGPDEFASAKQLTCLLAQDSLGYLSENDFEDLTETVLADYDQAGGDMVYAQALGYFDGLMFGLPEGDVSQVSARLRSFVESQACTGTVSLGFSL
jgi:hypothetical protein